MSWDESLFSYFSKKFKERRSREANYGAQVQLCEIQSRLRMLACALSGAALEVREAEKFGGHRQSHVFLPGRIALFSTAGQNWNAYLFRLVFTLASREQDVVLSCSGLSDAEVRSRTLLAVPATLQALQANLPQSAGILKALGAELKPRLVELAHEPWIVFLCLACQWELPADLKPEVLQLAGNTAKLKSETAFLLGPKNDWVFVLFGTLQERGKASSFAAAPEGLGLESLSSGTEKKAKPREHAEEIRLGEDKEGESPLVHVFEKVLTAEDYTGGKKSLDGSDELDDHAEALDELNLRHVIRSRDRANSIFKSDAMIDGGAPDLEEGEAPPASAFIYDEWDHSKQDYRRGWCTVHASSAVAKPNSDDAPCTLAEHHSRTVRQLRAELEKLQNERRWKNRQTEGSELDFDALVERTVDLKCRQTPSNRVFISRRRSEREFAATILLDMSLSTDSWVDNRHVIQVARESVLILSEVLEGITKNVSVAGFYSNTRRDCRVIEFKNFKEDWSGFRKRLSVLSPTGYTRIGPALRHCTSELNKTGTRKKLLLLVSDGKPSDYDRYEGTYGIRDVRQAIREALQTGVHVRSLAIASEAKFYLPQMFGQGGYQILPHPAHLAPALSKVFAQCLK